MRAGNFREASSAVETRSLSHRLTVSCESYLARRNRCEAGLAAFGQALADFTRFAFLERTKARAIERVAVDALEGDDDARGLAQHVHRAFGVSGELRLGGDLVAEGTDLDRPVVDVLRRLRGTRHAERRIDDRTRFGRGGVQHRLRMV